MEKQSEDLLLTRGELDLLIGIVKKDNTPSHPIKDRILTKLKSMKKKSTQSQSYNR